MWERWIKAWSWSRKTFVLCVEHSLSSRALVRELTKQGTCFPGAFFDIIYISLSAMFICFCYKDTVADTSLFLHESRNFGKSIGLAREKHGLLQWNSTTEFLIIRPDVYYFNKNLTYRWRWVGMGEGNINESRSKFRICVWPISAT
jgi:hypothetical protein